MKKKIALMLKFVVWFLAAVGAVSIAAVVAYAIDPVWDTRVMGHLGNRDAIESMYSHYQQRGDDNKAADWLWQLNVWMHDNPEKLSAEDREVMEFVEEAKIDLDEGK